jgi:TetR/AcrR family transcriptional regulator, cholesterol catabolism regulator
MTAHRGAANPTILDEVALLKRERTIHAAVDLFYEHGYEKTPLDVVAQKLGVTKPFIYANFGSKSELLAEICSLGIASSLEAIDGVLELRASPVESLTLLSQRFVTAVLGSQKHIAIYMREEKNLEPRDAYRIGEMRRDFDAKLSRLLEKGAVSGEFDIRDSRMAALAIGGLVSWAYTWYRPKGRLKLPEVADQMTSLVLAMAGVRLSSADNKNRHAGRAQPRRDGVEVPAKKVPRPRRRK